MPIEHAPQFATDSDAGKLQAELRQLKRTMRDLVALSIMPAAWVGRGPRHIAQGLLELLITTLRLDVAYVCLNGIAGDPGCDLVQSQDWPEFETWIRENETSLRPSRKAGGISPPAVINSASPGAVLRVQTVAIGMETPLGMVAVGSSRPDFPSEPEKLLLSVAANQATTALQAAQLSAERASISRELLQSEEKFRSLSACSPVGIFLTDTAPHWIYTNPRCQAICGFTFEKALEEGWVAFVHPDDRARVLYEWTEAARQGQEFDREFRWANPRTGVRWTHVRSAPLYNDEHQLLGHVGTIEDITLRKHTEDALREREEQVRFSEERLRAALAASDTGTFRWAPHTGEFLEFGPNLKRLFGLREEQPVRTTEDMLGSVHPDDVVAVRSAAERCAREGADFEMEFRIVRPNGEVRWLYDRARMEWIDGRPTYLIGACTDITDRRLAQDALMESEKLASVGRLAATVAHEINNPLEAVTNYIYLAKNNRELPEKIQRYLKLADQELARVTHIAQQTLGFYRDNSHPMRVVVADAIEDVLAIYERKLRYKDLTVTRRFRPELKIETLLGELKQIISNLISNAIDASVHGGRIIVCARAARTWKGGAEGGIHITIADTGSGMRAEVQSKVFTPFFTTKEDVGTGLGLWITRNIVEKRGGHIRFRSRAGAGTVMRVFLPK